MAWGKNQIRACVQLSHPCCPCSPTHLQGFGRPLATVHHQGEDNGGDQAPQEMLQAQA